MPDIDQLPDSQLIKMIYIGDSGSGKTGSNMSLAAAGYNLWILDVDKGVDILKDYATTPIGADGKPNIYLNPRPPLWGAEQVAGLAKRIKYVTISETFTNKAGNVIPKGDSFKAILDQLTEWKDGEKSFGKLESWTSNDVLIIDSFSRVCDARMYLELVMNGRAVTGRQQSDYWKVQDSIERFLELLVGPGIPCHVILIGHIDYVEKDDGTTRGMPQSMGKALGPKIAQHFNHALLAKSTGQGTLAKRKILTQTTGTIDLKNAAPLKVKPEYEIETGLAEYFLAVLGRLPSQQPKPTT